MSAYIVLHPDGTVTLSPANLTVSDTPTQTIADALLILSLGNDNAIGKDAAERLMKLERENAALNQRVHGKEKQITEMLSFAEALILSGDRLHAILKDPNGDWAKFDNIRSAVEQWESCKENNPVFITT